MAYTCAYYPTAQATLEQAQIAKMDHVCRKLRLERGGFGGRGGLRLGQPGAAHGARTTARKVRAFNISHEQIEFARRRARERGPRRSGSSSSRMTTATSAGPATAFVSVGMLEHVGLENYAELGRVCARAP